MKHEQLNKIVVHPIAPVKFNNRSLTDHKRDKKNKKEKRNFRDQYEHSIVVENSSTYEHLKSRIIAKQIVAENELELWAT